jgi:hypothetical protein
VIDPFRKSWPEGLPNMTSRGMDEASGHALETSVRFSCTLASFG